MKRVIKIIGLLLLLLGVVTACEKENRAGVVTLDMKDHPGMPSAYEEVNVEIKEIQFLYVAGPGSRGGWIKLRTNAGVYNLLKLQNGVTVTLVERMRIPTGKITHYKLLLGDDNSVRLRGGRLVPLTLAAEFQNGVVKPMNTIVRPGSKIKIVLGFDSAASVVEEATGEYRLKPTLSTVYFQNQRP
jgi:hypothetical protein